MKVNKFENLIGKVILKITGLEAGSEDVLIETSDGAKYRMYHEQDCCESVYIEDVVGDVNDIIGRQITLAEQATNEGEPANGHDESWTWTFYRLATVSGYVTIRWFGTSNGYYSESVSFYEI